MFKTTGLFLGGKQGQILYFCEKKNCHLNPDSQSGTYPDLESKPNADPCVSESEPLVLPKFMGECRQGNQEALAPTLREVDPDPSP